MSRTIRHDRKGNVVKEKDLCTSYENPPKDWRVDSNRSLRRKDRRTAEQMSDDIPRKDHSRAYYTW